MIFSAKNHFLMLNTDFSGKKWTLATKSTLATKLHLPEQFHKQ